MRIDVSVQNDVPRAMVARVGRMERAVKSAVSGATLALKTTWRADVAGKLGARLGGAVRAEVYPKGDVSLNAAGLVWTKAPEIIGAHEKGALIRSTTGLWLAIPLPAAGRVGRGRANPATWQFSHGRKLRFVPISPTKALLVLEDARVSKAGLARRKGGKRRRDGILTGAQSVPVFVLIRQAKLPKRLNLKALGMSAGQGLPGRVRTALGAAI